MKTKPPTMIDITPRVRFYNKKDITQNLDAKSSLKIFIYEAFNPDLYILFSFSRVFSNSYMQLIKNS